MVAFWRRGAAAPLAVGGRGAGQLSREPLDRPAGIRHYWRRKVRVSRIICARKADQRELAGHGLNASPREVESEPITHATDRDPPFAVLHVPHASRVVPAQARASILLTHEALSAELLRMTDSFTDELFRLDPRVARSVVFPASRLVVDPERFLDDSAEPMLGRGMGVVYTQTADRAALRGTVDEKTRRALVTAYYQPHHRRHADQPDRSAAVGP